MNIKVAPFTVSEKSSNTYLYYFRIEIRVDDESKKISYDSGGGFWFFSDDSDDKYKILFGGSSNDGARFMGKLINFFIKGRCV